MLDIRVPFFCFPFGLTLGRDGYLSANDKLPLTSQNAISLRTEKVVHTNSLGIVGKITICFHYSSESRAESTDQ